MSTTDIDYSARAKDVLGFSRWWQVAAAVVMMGLVSPYQYVWSSIRSPMANRLAIDPAALGAVFTLFVIFQAGSQFPVGWWRDRHGPRALTLLAGLLAGGGYLGLSRATSVWQLYVLYSLGAVGVGIVYTVAVNTALKWFPDRRGLTTGLGTMAFAGGSALVVPYVRANATAANYPGVLRNMGLLIGIGIIVGAVVLRDPPKGWLEATTNGGDDAGSDADPTARKQYTWREMAGTWQFWVMYVMFVCASGAGLMLTAKVVSFAENLGLAAVIATVSATVLPVAGGVGRLVVGDASDRLDREKAMAASFFLCGIGLFAVVWFARAESNVGFILAVIVATFFWSPQYTLFPSVVGDYYGREHSSANYALLYSGKMWGGVFGGAVTGFLITATGWTTAFLVGGVLAIVAAVGALFLRPPTDS
ncbi:oxalate/formate antiporter [Haladaptatus paucihalophilus DX253]|uniref:Oxalate/formate antiporter n=1 Tax=Haladaptatus paucihalophilus DX253 TaxID=797209 RepID=E7QRU2_HALPU|nr:MULTISPECIES: OFA family MFS transporter [Haladaptatus]EFW92711.1 oxalate/formate antiporter [Haladaptatus paucihalophilus DX253]GKZ13691.1 MFS transporter [Haladaptatus sp. T7]SHK14935.1 MFS transporter, OFA family, oxalate/formate antiporter [Haladaptatus paucihalophilus DX253]